jgi:hypothetical protein
MASGDRRRATGNGVVVGGCGGDAPPPLVLVLVLVSNGRRDGVAVFS